MPACLYAHMFTSLTGAACHNQSAAYNLLSKATSALHWIEHMMIAAALASADFASTEAPNLQLVDSQQSQRHKLCKVFVVVQGDRERGCGLPVSPLMDRTQQGGMTRSQVCAASQMYTACCFTTAQLRSSCKHELQQSMTWLPDTVCPVACSLASLALWASRCSKPW